MGHPFKVFLPLLTALALSAGCAAQDTAATWQYSVAPAAGYLLPHHPEMRYLPRKRLWSTELSASRTTDGSKPWHHWYNFPQWGIMLDLYDFGSPYLGRGAAGKVFFDLPLDRGKRFGLKLSIGAGWVEKPFDLQNNIHNSAIGSRLNAALGVEGYVRVNLGGHFTLKPGVGLAHFSNGAYKMPNSGINMPSLRLGLAYRPVDHVDPTRRYPTRYPAFVGARTELFVGLSGGAKEIKPIGGPKYGVVNVLAFWTLRVSPKSSLGVEAGLNYNASLRHRPADVGRPPSPRAYNYRPYVAGLYELHFDPLIIRFGLGAYIAPKFRDDGAVFLRYHLVYQWQGWQIFAGLKSHYAQADNIEVGLARRLFHTSVAPQNPLP